MKRFFFLMVACLLVQGLGDFLSLTSGLEVFAYLGSMVAVVSGGLLPGFLVDLAGSALGLIQSDERWFTTTVDFAVLLFTAYAARRGYFASWRKWLKASILLGIFAGVFSLGINSLIGRTAFGMTRATAFLSPLMDAPADSNVVLLTASILVHLVDIVVSFAILAFLAHRGWLPVAGGLYEDEWQSRHVRKTKLGVKFVLYLTLSALFTGGVMFFLSTGVYYNRMVRNYGSIAASYVNGLAQFVDPSTLDEMAYPGGDRTAAYRKLYMQVSAYTRRTDKRLRHAYIDQISYTEKGVPYLQVLVEPGLTGKTYGTAVSPGNYHFLMDAENLSHETGTDILGPFWADEQGKGRFLTVYKPLYDTDGRKVAYAGVELDMSDAYRALRRLQGKVIAIECIVFSLLMAFVYGVITREIIRPLEKLSTLLVRFGEKDNTALVKAGRLTSGDELEELYLAIEETQDQIVKDRDSLAAYTDKIAQMAQVDPLTGVKSHTAYVVAVETLNRKIKEGNASFAVVMADMNGLKQVNDLYGHAKGDLALKAMAESLCSSFVHSPVFRVGGDEFVIILEGADYLARDLLFQSFSIYRRTRNFAVPEPWNETALSAGLAVYRRGEDKSFQDVFNRADQRMYEEKRRLGGR